MKLPEPALLQVLVAFQESKNLIQAAEKLKISQPAVTQRLNRLQEQTEHPLYAFEGRKKVLTHYGKALYELAKQNFLQFQTSFENLNRRYATSDQLVLRVGGQKELVGLFSALIEFSGCIDHRKMSEEQILEALDAETIDVALSGTITDSTELMSRKFFESASRLVFHRKFFPSVVHFRDIEEHVKLLIQTPCVLHRWEAIYMEKFCKAMKINFTALNARATFEDWYSIQNFMESGGGYAVVPGFVQSQSKDVRFLDIPHTIIPRAAYYAVFPRKLKKIDSFKPVLNFEMRSF